MATGARISKFSSILLRSIRPLSSSSTLSIPQRVIGLSDRPIRFFGSRRFSSEPSQGTASSTPSYNVELVSKPFEYTLDTLTKKEKANLPPGCDFNHWLVAMQEPNKDTRREEIIRTYVETLAEVLGSEEEAKKAIYSVSTKHYFAFGCVLDEELSWKLKASSAVRFVFPDSYMDVENKDYGGEPFINGEAVPYDPKYHAEWLNNNEKRIKRLSKELRKKQGVEARAPKNKQEQEA